MSKKLGAEFIGTFWLVLGGCGSAVLAAGFPDVGIGLLGVALAFGSLRRTGGHPEVSCLSTTRASTWAVWGKRSKASTRAMR